MFFSIIIATYKPEINFFTKTLNSIKNQTFKDFEVVIADYNSDRKILKFLKSFNLNLRIIKIKKKGWVLALNEGIRQASGEYILCLGSDDMLFDKNVLKDVYYFIIKNKYDVFYGKIAEIDIKDNIIGIFPEKKFFQKVNKFYLTIFNYIPHYATFFNKKIFKKIGLFKENLIHSAESEFFLRLIYNNEKIYFYDRFITKFRIWDIGNSSNIKNLFIRFFEHLIVIKNYCFVCLFIFTPIYFFSNLYVRIKRFIFRLIN